MAQEGIAFMEVSYIISREDMFRCNTYLMTRLPLPAAGFLVGSIAVARIFYIADQTTHAHPNVVMALTIAIITFMVLEVTYFLLNIWAVNYISNLRSLKPLARRYSCTKISEEGVQDIMPEQDKSLSWGAIKSVRYNQGDIYFAKLSAGVMVPRTAFNSTEEAQQFYKKALELWQMHH